MTKKVVDLNDYKQKHKITFDQQRPFDITDNVDEKKDILIFDEELSTYRIDEPTDPDESHTVLDKLMKMNKELFKDDNKTHKPDTCSLIEQLIDKNKNNKKPNADDILDIIRDRNHLHITIKNPRKKKRPKKD